MKTPVSTDSLHTRSWLHRPVLWQSGFINKNGRRRVALPVLFGYASAPNGPVLISQLPIAIFHFTRRDVEGVDGWVWELERGAPLPTKFDFLIFFMPMLHFVPYSYDVHETMFKSVTRPLYIPVNIDGEWIFLQPWRELSHAPLATGLIEHKIIYPDQTMEVFDELWLCNT